MNKFILLIALLLTILGCDNRTIQIKDYENLQRENAKLKQENKILNDSLSDYNENLIRSQILIGIPDEQSIKVAKNNNIKVIFHPFGVQLPKYDIYRVDGLKEVKIGSNNKTEFDYTFIPKSVKDNEINLKVKIPFKKDTVEIPASMVLPVEE